MGVVCHYAYFSVGHCLSWWCLVISILRVRGEIFADGLCTYNAGIITLSLILALIYVCFHRPLTLISSKPMGRGCDFGHMSFGHIDCIGPYFPKCWSLFGPYFLKKWSLFGPY